jgi:hypothetical protein
VKAALKTILLLLVASAASAEIDVSIKFYDKRIYYPESEIAIRVTIANNSPSTYRFKLAEDHMFSLAFEARTPANRTLDAASAFKKSRADSRPVFYREISVESGEEYSFVEHLESYVAISEAGNFSVRASFWPDLAQGSSDHIEPMLSNILVLSVRPSPAGISPAAEVIRRETGELLLPEAIPPDEVVRRTIVARQRSRWNEFFLYLDLEALLKKSAELSRSFNRESEEGRRAMLEKYRTNMEANLTDSAIVMLPTDFSIIETRYSANLGAVRVVEKFPEKGFKTIKEYEYEVRRRDDIWFIVGYTVVNKGTE